MMNAADLASAMLLFLVAGGGAFVVQRFVGNTREEQRRLAHFAQSLAKEGPVTPWRRRGHRFGEMGSRTAFCVDVFTQATMRGGVVDIWHLQKESAALAHQQFALIRPKGEANGRFDLEGSRHPERLLVEGNVAPGFTHPSVMATLESLFRTWRVRFLRVENNCLEIGVERVASTTTELKQILDAMNCVMQALEKETGGVYLPAPDPDQCSVASASGAPVLVPLLTRRSRT